MKKILALILAMGLAVCMLAACSSSSSQTEETTTTAAETEPETDSESLDITETGPGPVVTDETEGEEEDTLQGELIVFAAASMTESLTEIGDLFMAEHPDVDVIFTFDSSGTLKTQIEEGADCDLFISAAQKQMNQLDIEADPEVNTDGLDFVDTATRIDLLENKVVLAVPEDNPAGIESFDQLAELFESGSVYMVMGNDDVPVGQYTEKILAYYNLDAATLAEQGLITYGTNVKECTTAVTEATVDCGVIYATDAYSAGLEWVDEATAEMCGQVIYPAAVLKVSTNPDVAQAFLDYLSSDEAAAAFEEVGFTPLT